MKSFGSNLYLLPVGSPTWPVMTIPWAMATCVIREAKNANIVCFIAIYSLVNNSSTLFRQESLVDHMDDGE